MSDRVNAQVYDRTGRTELNRRRHKELPAASEILLRDWQVRQRLAPGGREAPRSLRHGPAAQAGAGRQGSTCPPPAPPSASVLPPFASRPRRRSIRRLLRFSLLPSLLGPLRCGMRDCSWSASAKGPWRSSAPPPPIPSGTVAGAAGGAAAGPCRRPAGLEGERAAAGQGMRDGGEGVGMPRARWTERVRATLAFRRRGYKKAARANPARHGVTARSSTSRWTENVTCAEDAATESGKARQLRRG